MSAPLFDFVPTCRRATPCQENESPTQFARLRFASAGVDPTGRTDRIDASNEIRRRNLACVSRCVRTCNHELPRKYQLDWLVQQIGKGDRFVSQDAQTGTQYGDYRVDGGILTATGYNDYLSRMTTRITDAMGRSLTSSASKYKAISQYPILQAYKALLTGWLDTYIRHRLFGKDFDPLEGENWRVLYSKMSLTTSPASLPPS